MSHYPITTLPCCPKIKYVKNETLLSEERGSKKAHVTKKSLDKKRKELKTRHENVILLKLCFSEITQRTREIKTKVTFTPAVL